MTGKLSKNFHGVGIGPLSKILAVKGFSVRGLSQIPFALRVGRCKLGTYVVKKFQRMQT